MPEELSAPAPAVLCLHGTTVDAKEACLGRGSHPGGSRGTAVDLARRGFITLVPDHFNAGERLKPGEKPYDSGPLYARHPGWSDMGKAIYDHRLCVDLLQTLPEVDGERIGCIGHSLGGYCTLFLAAMDERIRAAVSSCGVTVWAADPNRLNWSRDQAGRYVHFPKLRILNTGGRHPWSSTRSWLSLPPCLSQHQCRWERCLFPVFAPFAELYVQVESVTSSSVPREVCRALPLLRAPSARRRALAYAWLAEQLEL